MSRILRLVALAVLASVLILLLGPTTSFEIQQPGLDKVAHFAAFGLVLWSLGILVPRVRRTHLAMVALILGAVTEGVQALVGRDPDLLDFAADAAGIGAALAAWGLWRGFRPRRARATPPAGQSG